MYIRNIYITRTIHVFCALTWVFRLLCAKALVFSPPGFRSNQIPERLFRHVIFYSLLISLNFGFELRGSKGGWTNRAADPPPNSALNN